MNVIQCDQCQATGPSRVKWFDVQMPAQYYLNRGGTYTKTAQGALRKDFCSVQCVRAYFSALLDGDVDDP